MYVEEVKRYWESRKVGYDRDYLFILENFSKKSRKKKLTNPPNHGQA